MAADIRRIDFVALLPAEQSMHIFGVLTDLRDLARCWEVSKLWRTIAGDHKVWISFWTSQWQSVSKAPFPIEAPTSSGMKKQRTVCVASNPKEIREYLQPLLDQTRRGDHSRFSLRCVFDPRCILEANIKVHFCDIPPKEAARAFFENASQHARASLETSSEDERAMSFPSLAKQRDAASPPVEKEVLCLYLEEFPLSAAIREYEDECEPWFAGNDSHRYYSALPQGTSLCPVTPLFPAAEMRSLNAQMRAVDLAFRVLGESNAIRDLNLEATLPSIVRMRFDALRKETS